MACSLTNCSFKSTSLLTLSRSLVLPHLWNPMAIQWLSGFSGEDHLIKGHKPSWAHQNHSDVLDNPAYVQAVSDRLRQHFWVNGWRIVFQEVCRDSRFIDLSSCSAVVEVWLLGWMDSLFLSHWNSFLSSPLFRNIAVLMETIKKGVHDADSEARSVARKWAILHMCHTNEISSYIIYS